MSAIVSSKKITARNIKLMFWGDTSTRKTEAVLRNFPHVFLIDTEGNSDQCVGNPDIPEFLQLKTKDPREVLKYLEMVEKGKVKFDDGSPVETVALDSWSILWSVQQEFANANAEKRASKYNRSVEDASVTQLDWGLAKRPMKMLTNKMANLPVRYLVLIGREKALYADNTAGGELKKIGVQADVVKGTEYEMNLCLHFINDPSGWCFETTKVQGMLGELFPMGKRQKAIPFQQLFAYSSGFKPSVGTEKSEVDIAGEQAEDQNHTKQELIDYGKSLGMTPTDIGQALKSKGFGEVDLNRWADMVMALDEQAKYNGRVN